MRRRRRHKAFGPERKPDSHRRKRPEFRISPHFLLMFAV
jgi:hypothetical protein